LLSRLNLARIWDLIRVTHWRDADFGYSVADEATLLNGSPSLLSQPSISRTLSSAEDFT
jgi:hypothetical protein